MLASCVPTKDLTYLREGEEVVDSLWVVNKQHQPYRVQVNDVLSIRVKALDPELVEFFNPAAGGESGGNALGIDRLIMLATDADHIDQVLWTPMPGS